MTRRAQGNEDKIKEIRELAEKDRRVALLSPSWPCFNGPYRP